MTDETWGPWIEHDGKGCPCRGMLAQLHYKDILRPENPRLPDDIVEGVVYGDLSKRSAWLWENANRVQVIIRYRIRRPKALRDLITLVETLPAPAQPMVDA